MKLIWKLLEIYTRSFKKARMANDELKKETENRQQFKFIEN